MECDLEFAGLLIMQNKLKPATTPAITELNEANIRTIMVTGNSNHIIFYSHSPFLKTDPYHDLLFFTRYHHGDNCTYFQLCISLFLFSVPLSFPLSLHVSLSLSLSLSSLSLSLSIRSCILFCRCAPSFYSLSVCVSARFLPDPFSPSQIFDNLTNVTCTCRCSIRDAVDFGFFRL